MCIKWVFPILGMVKLNVNSACIKGVVAGYGGIVRDDNGCWMRGFSMNVGICSNYMPELRGLLEGLMLVLDLRFRRVKVNADSSEIIMDVTQGRSRKIEGLEMLKKIGNLLSV